MPQSSNWPEIYKFEDYFEPAAVNILAADSITAHVQRNATDIATPSVGVQLTVGENVEHYGLRVSDGQNFCDRWNAKLAFAITTQRGKNNSSHSDLRAKIRYRMQDLTVWNTTRLPYHQVVRIIESGTSPQIVDDKDRDISEVTFSLVINIRADAWPAAAF